MAVKLIVTNIWYQVEGDGQVQVQDLKDDEAIKDLNHAGRTYNCSQTRDLKLVNCTIDTINHGWSISLDSCHVKKVTAVGYVLLKNCKDIEVETPLDVFAQECENVKIKARNVYLFDTLKAELTVVDYDAAGSEKTKGQKLELKVTRVVQKKVQEAADAKKSEIEPS